MVGRILLTLVTLAVTSFVLLVLIGLWDRYERETVALGFSGIYERYFGAVGQVAPAQSFQQRPKLVGTGGAVGSTNQGMSVALSADGNTAIVGGPGPNNADRDQSPFVGPVGAAWVFTRSGGGWRQQGGKLVGTTSEYGGGLWSQGASVALSADGNTAIVGGPSDNRTMGATWVFTRSGDVWMQQGNKLVGSGAGEPPLPPGQGISVALSADGNTAIVGSWGAEAAWVFTRSSGTWTQQGKKLVGTGAVGKARQGMSVALSADGNSAIVGGWSDNGKTGAAWVFTRSGGVWTQQGKKLVGTDAVGSARQGTSVALSADGNTAIVGGPGDNPWDRSVPFGLGAAGAAWVFTRSGGVWTQQGDKLVGTGAVASARQAPPSRCPRTAISPSWVALPRMGVWHWCSPAVAVAGRRTRSWLAPALWGSPHPLSRCPPTAASSWSAELTTMGASARRGCSRAAAVTGRTTRTWLAPHPQRPPTAASSWSAGLMTTGAWARQRCSPTAAVVAPILKNPPGHLFHLTLR